MVNKMKDNYKNLLQKTLVALGLLSVLTTGSALAHEKNEIRYRYVSLEPIKLPAPIAALDLRWLTDDGKIYGNAFECDDANCSAGFGAAHIASYTQGKLNVSSAIMQGNAINDRGTVAGFLSLGFDENLGVDLKQAALFRNNAVKLITPIPDEYDGQAKAINDKGTVFLESFGYNINTGVETIVRSYFKNGQNTPLNLDPNPLFFNDRTRLTLNNHDVLAGTGFFNISPFVFGNRAFRYNPMTKTTATLAPLPTDSTSWGLDLNEKGEVLGYSFTSFNGRETIGVWGKSGQFKTYFVEGTPEFPTISNRLLFNDEGLIVITALSAP
jgi:hypothetical protein